MKRFVLGLLACCLHLFVYSQMPASFAIPVSVIADNTGIASITLSWPANLFATSYTIKKKIVTDSSYLSPFIEEGTITQSAADATAFTDLNVEAGVLYEYEISATYTTEPVSRSMYVCAGINIKTVHNRGTIILLCDEFTSTNCQAKLSLLYQDLVGDGWKVVKLVVPRSDNPAEVKTVRSNIIDACNNYHNVKQVLIVGHVPVPYSGNFTPDGHTNHNGCWPADGYYGCLGGTWTDNIASSSVASTRPANINLPGDGKFDQDSLPQVQLAVGRIDFSNLPVFSAFEEDLINAYIDKNHAFRHGQVQLKKQALVEDNFTSFAEKFSQSAWKSYGSLAGFDNVFEGQYETDLLSSQSYLWSYGAGGGNYTGAGGIGNSGNFVTNPYKTVFTQLFGSYFGDWDSQDNFMRSSLASPGSTLACVWGGRPHWYLHHMGAGLPIGYSTLLTMNNRGIYTNTGYGNAQVHIALMGDPSLRSSYTKPPQAFFAQANQNKINLIWTRADETNIAGYYIYRSNSIAGQFTRLNDTLITRLLFTDSTPLNGNNVYMVRTAKVDSFVATGNFTNSSTYLNLSQGLFDSATVAIAPQAPVIFLEQLGQAAAPKQVAITGSSIKKYFVGQKNGDVKLYDNDFNLTGTYLSVPGINEGFFSMAFSPRFESDKLLYVFYTNANGDLELARFKENTNGDIALPDGTLFTIPNPGDSKNLGGEIHFGPDGNLYISTGDGDTRAGDAKNAQNKQSLLGKILRITPADGGSPANAYTIPPDNPHNNEVFILGLRFPYRWGFDRLTKDIWIGDRGDSSIEEANRILLNTANNANFGWPCYEGNNTYNADGCNDSAYYKFPVHTYPSPGNGSSITGGTVYRGEAFMALRGYYIFADASNSKIYLVQYDSARNEYTTVSQLLVPGAISDISEDSNGELYATSLLGGIYRIGASGPRLYRFTGNGNWDNPNNWANKTISPSELPSGSEIIISPAGSGECILNVQQTVSTRSKITVEDNKRFKVLGNLRIQ